MKILALDTSMEACSAAVLLAGKVFARFEAIERGHAERILTMVDDVLGESGVQLRELDAIAFGRGPGAFTGVRLAASVAQGLAFAAERRVVPVSDLRALAQAELDAAPEAASVLVCADARLKEVYWGYFGRDPQGQAQAAGPESVGSPALVDRPDALAWPCHGTGRGFSAYPELGQRLAGALSAVHPDRLPAAGVVARLAVSEVAAGRTLEPQDAVPVYLRDRVAEPPSRK